MEHSRFELGDCRDGLRGLPDACIDLVVSSPPYDDVRDFGSPWNMTIFGEVAGELIRVLRPGGVICWQVQDGVLKRGPLKGSYSANSLRQAVHFQDRGLLLWQELIAGPCGTRIGYPGRYEAALHHLYVLSKGKPSHVNLLWDRPNRNPGLYTPSWRRNADGTSYRAQKPYRIRRWGRRQAIWLYPTGRSISSDGEAVRHPAPMIEPLCRDLIHSYSRPGDLVCDPFGGIATTARQCLLLSRRYVSWELNPAYHAIGEARLAAAREQYRLALDREI